MRILALSLMALLACTKPNPNRCCTDEADCAAANLPIGMTCDDGHVCRGNVCIVESCDSTAGCDPSAPYCANPPDGVCQESCTEDTQCPGNGQPTDARFCEGGTCVACRTANDCDAAHPLCSAGACVACTTHDQCASGACTVDGVCASESDVAHVDVVGSPTSDCTASAPCSTIERALALLPPRTYVVIRPGTYTRNGPLTFTDTRWLIGSGTPRAILDRQDNGPIVLAQGAVNLHLERLEISGATGDLLSGPLMAGYAVYCRPAAGAPIVSLRETSIRSSTRGIGSMNCTVSVSQSVFTGLEYGLELRNSTANVDRNTFLAAPVTLDSGVFNFQNNFVARSPGTGVELYSTGTGNVIAFNTIVDNGLVATPSFGFDCQVTTPASFPSNIIARNQGATRGTDCTFPGSIVVDADITALKFKQPDVAPYDYHIMPGSLAVDMGTISTLDHDFDGDARPKGAGRDVGADEAQ